jgi:hypothetical protein
MTDDHGRIGVGANPAFLPRPSVDTSVFGAGVQFMDGVWEFWGETLLVHGGSNELETREILIS